MHNNDIAYLELLGVTMSGVRRPDQGFYWTDLTGWWGLPEVRGDADNIPGNHGRFKRKNLYRESRVITLIGHILAESNDELVAVRDRLEHALSAGAGIMKVVTNATGPWERYVEVDTLTIEPDHGRRYTKFTVDMVAPDPLRYGPEFTVGPALLPVPVGGVNLPQRMPWNFGQMSQEARISVANSQTGTLLHPTIVISGGGYSEVTVIDVTDGRRLTLNWEVDSGSELILNSSTRRALLDGNDMTRWMLRKQWFSIDSGETHEFRFEVNDRVGDPRMWARYQIGAW